MKPDKTVASEYGQIDIRPLSLHDYAVELRKYQGAKKSRKTKMFHNSRKELIKDCSSADLYT